MAKRDQEIVRLKEVVEQLSRAGDDLFSARDTAADIGRLIADRLLQKLSPAKVHDVLDRLVQLVCVRAELPRDPMKTELSKRGKKHRQISGSRGAAPS